MGRKRIPEHIKKVSLTIGISAFLRDNLKDHGKPSALIESLLLEYFNNKRKKD